MLSLRRHSRRGSTREHTSQPCATPPSSCALLGAQRKVVLQWSIFDLPPLRALSREGLISEVRPAEGEEKRRNCKKGPVPPNSSMRSSTTVSESSPAHAEP